MSQSRSTRRKVTRILFACLAALGAIALLCDLLWPRERLLLTIAHKLPLSTDTYFSFHDQYSWGVWRSSHEQLLLHHTPGEDHGTVWVRDILTGQKTPLQPFNDRFASQLKLIPHISARRGATGKSEPIDYLLPTQQLSPDGKWLLWRDGQTWRAFATDGSAQREWPRDPQENRYRRYVNWGFNGEGWLQPCFDSTFHVNGVMLHALESNAPEGERMFAQSGGGWVLGTTRQRHLLTYNLQYGAGFKKFNPYTLYDTDLETNHAQTREREIALPPGTSTADVHLSPDGTRLLWNLQIQQEPPGPPLIQNFLRRCGMKTRLQNALWVSNTDGTNLREVGHITNSPLPPSPPAGANAMAVIRFQSQSLKQQLTTRLYSIQWLLDSKHALFVRGNEVYEVDVY